MELSERTQQEAVARQKLEPSFVERIGWGGPDGLGSTSGKKTEARKLAEQARANHIGRCVFVGSK